jgi:hypothetical protein
MGQHQTSSAPGPFRLAMLKLAKERNASIEAGAAMMEVQKQGLFLVETEIYARLAESQAVIQNPAKHWYRRGVELVKAVPELAVNLAA